VAILVSEMDDWTVRLVKDVDGCERAREEPRGGNDCATSETAEPGKLAQQTSSNASNGRKRSCESRDARRAGSNSDGSREYAGAGESGSSGSGSDPGTRTSTDRGVGSGGAGSSAGRSSK